MKTTSQILKGGLALFIIIINSGIPASSQSVLSDSDKIGIKGGLLVVNDEENFCIVVRIPRGALFENQTLTLSVITGNNLGPFTKNVINGIRLDPAGLYFMDKIEFEVWPYSHDVSENDVLFWLKNNKIAIPCGNQHVSVDKNTVSGSAYVSGNFVLVTPSQKEILEQTNRLMEAYPVSVNNVPVFAPTQKKGPSPHYDFPEGNDCLKWQEVNMVLDGIVKYIDFAQALGNFNEDKIWQNWGKRFLQNKIDDFLNKPLPENPCGNYLWAITHYILAEARWGLNINMDKSPLMGRYESVADQCNYQFTLETREWIRRKERRDDGGTVDEKLNRYGMYTFYVPWMEFIRSGEIKVNGTGAESIQYEKKATVAGKERNETTSGTRKVTDVRGGVQANFNEFGVSDIQVEIKLILKNDLKSRAWGKGYGSKGEYDSESSNTSESKETKRFPFKNFESKFGDENAGWSMRVVFLQEPSWKDRSNECW